jgi:ribosomal protein S18 acetylase RimI-like enzyme
MRAFVIEQATAVTAELVAAFERLLPQLSASAPPLGATELAEIVRTPATTLLVARSAPGAAIVGAVTLVLFRIPSGLRARIESLVVDEGARGRGVGRALCEEALARAKVARATTVDLTSSPARQAANHLYETLGFEARRTNVYRFTFAGAQYDSGAAEA